VAGEPDLALAELVAARLCHDLANPLAAVAAGVELISLGGAGAEEARLVADSAAAATERLAFLRLAFGPIASDAAPVTAAALAGMLAARYAGTRITATVAGAPVLPRAGVRLALLAVLCCEAALARGGSIAVAEGAGAWCVRAEAERWRDLDRLWPLIEGAPAPTGLRAAEVPFVLAPRAAAALGRQLELRRAPEAVEIGF
jgi:histidine phosphotransferase ChpT